MKNEHFKLIIFLEFLMVYILSSYILKVNYITLTYRIVNFFIVYFLIISIIASIKGKSFLFSELERFWVYSFAPIICYVLFLLKLHYHLNVSAKISFFPLFLISNFYKLDFENRKTIAVSRLIGFAVFLLGVC